MRAVPTSAIVALADSGEYVNTRRPAWERCCVMVASPVILRGHADLRVTRSRYTSVIKAGDVRAMNLRQENICSHAVVLRALGAIGSELL